MTITSGAAILKSLSIDGENLTNLAPADARHRPARSCDRYASLRISCGDDPVYVTTQLGHTEVGFSMSFYARAVKRRGRLSGALLEELEKDIVWAHLGATGDLDPATEAASALLQQVTD